jgi:hypothetical protein
VTADIASPSGRRDTRDALEALPTALDPRRQGSVARMSAAIASTSRTSSTRNTSLSSVTDVEVVEAFASLSVFPNGVNAIHQPLRVLGRQIGQPLAGDLDQVIDVDQLLV